MDFRDFATKETSSLIDRLTAGAVALASDARAAAEAEAQKAIAPLRAELKERNAQVAALEAAVKEHTTKLGALEAKVKDRSNEVLELQAEVKERTREFAALEKTVKDRTAEVATLEKTIDDLRTKAERAEAARSADAQARATAEDALKKARAALDAATAEKKDIARRLESLEDAHAETDRARRQMEIKLAAAATTEKTLRTQPLDRLLATFQQLAKSTTSAGVMTALVDGLAAEFGRVALFTVSSNRVEGMHQVGFDFKSDISKIVMPLTKDSESLLMHAVTSGRVQGHAGRQLTEASCAPFGGNPAFVLTVPVTVRGKTVAVIYADTGEQPPNEVAPERGVKFAELLLWHAVPMLSKLMAEVEAATDVRNYAKLLLDEVEEMYANDIEANVAGDELTARLKENLECARRLFAQRITAEGSWAAPLKSVMDDALAAAVEAHAGTAFGTDLAAIVGESTPQPRARRAERA